MAAVRIVPDLKCTDPDAMAHFLSELLGMTRVMDMGWITTVQSPAQTAMQISSATQGGSGNDVPTLSIEVDDFNETLERAQAMGATIPYGPVKEPWGVRRFYVETPEGHVLNILCHA